MGCHGNGHVTLATRRPACAAPSPSPTGHQRTLPEREKRRGVAQGLVGDETASPPVSEFDLILI